MAGVIRCNHPGRLERLGAQSDVNAVDYLIVVDGVGVPPGLRQRLLLVRFLLPDGVDGLNGNHVRIEGGVRFVNPPVRLAGRLSDLDPAVASPADPVQQAYLQSLIAATDQADRWLAVFVAGPGDLSTYTLRLRDGDQPPAGFDQVLSEVDFSFKVECPSPFDCFREESCPAEVAEEPELEYLARDFPSFRRLMFDRLALIAPTDLSREPAELRTALVETVAYVADQLAYFQDAAATEAYLGTARTRPSVRRWARLLDYPIHEGCNARAFVHLTLQPGTSVSGRPLRENALLLTRLPWGGPSLPASALEAALAEGPAVFAILWAPAGFSADNNAISIYTWGDGDCCLPRRATSLDLVDPGDLALAAGDFLVLEQTRSPDTGSEADADPERRVVVRLVEVGDPVEDLLFPGTMVRTVRWADGDATPFDLPISTGGQPVAVARGNVLLADHGRTIAGEPVVLKDWGSLGHLRATLGDRGLSWRQRLPEQPESARALLVQDPRDARASVTLYGENERWSPIPDLLSSLPSARQFVVEMENDGRARIRFGDGTMGRRPTGSEGFTADYRTGNGEEGNVGAEAIAHVVADPAVVDAALSSALAGLRNPLPATGGVSAETIAEVKRYAPVAFRTQERAVTERDWVEMTERDPGVQRAVAQRRWTGSWHTVFITVDPVAGTSFETLHESLTERLERLRLAGYDLEIVPPAYVPLDVALTVCVDWQHFPDEVERALLTEFGTGVLPDGRRGFFHPDEFTFGDSVWLSQIVARCMSIAGVSRVDVTSTSHDIRFRRRGYPQGPEIAEGRIRIGALEIARCDNDPNVPDNGQIRFYMEGGV